MTPGSSRPDSPSSGSTARVMRGSRSVATATSSTARYSSRRPTLSSAGPISGAQDSETALQIVRPASAATATRPEREAGSGNGPARQSSSTIAHAMAAAAARGPSK
jgi:hypothetical protein